ncbi:MAG: sigma-70 family RNA polymerase sigma factor [Planctomycetota bacterium]
MNPDRRNLIERASLGDAPALDELLIENLPMLEAYVRVHAGQGVKRRESLTDLVQSVCGDVLAGADAFEFRGEAQFRHWLCKRALHKIVDKGRFHRAAKRDLGREESAAEGGPQIADRAQNELTPSRILGGQEDWEALEKAFTELNDEQREAVTLKRIVGMSYSEIAESMGRTEAAVRNLVFRGLARLTSLLEDSGDS